MRPTLHDKPIETRQTVTIKSHANEIAELVSIVARLTQRVEILEAKLK